MNEGYPIDLEFLDECAKITEGYEKLWGRWSLDSQLFHVVCEVAELKDALRNKKEKYGKIGSKEHRATINDELADVFLTAFATANFLRIPKEELNKAIITKLAEVDRRLRDAEQNKVQPEASQLDAGHWQHE